MRLQNLDPSNEKLIAFCCKWKLAELAIFGSALRDDFGPASDVDVLVSFAPGGAMTYEGYLEMRQ